MTDVVVVGGGLLGSSVAYELVGQGLEVTLVERLDLGQATAAGAGILSAATSRWGDDQDSHFAHNARDFYASLVPRVEEDGGGETGYSEVDVMIVAGSGDSREEFETARETMLARGQRRDPEVPQLRDLTPEEAKRRFPALGEVQGALVDEHGARVDGRELRSALQRAATGRGLKLVRDGVDRLAVEAGRVSGVVLRDRTIPCGSVVLATGAWLSQFQETLGLLPAVSPMRGQICHLRWSAGPTSGWSVVVGMRGHYILPWSSGRVVVGATREQGSGLVTDLTAAGCQEVLGEALRLAPGLGEASIQEWRVGLRPVSVDGNPILGSVPGLESCFLATGHGAGGLLLGPWSAHLLAREIATGRPEPALERYRPARFAAPTEQHPGPQA